MHETGAHERQRTDAGRVHHVAVDAPKVGARARDHRVRVVVLNAVLQHLNVRRLLQG